jgi:hypothetical protein
VSNVIRKSLSDCFHRVETSLFRSIFCVSALTGSLAGSGCSGDVTVDRGDEFGRTSSGLGQSGSTAVQPGLHVTVTLPIGPHCPSCNNLAPQDYGVAGFLSFSDLYLVHGSYAKIDTDAAGYYQVDFNNNGDVPWNITWTWARWMGDFGLTAAQVSSIGQYPTSYTNTTGGSKSIIPRQGCTWAGVEGNLSQSGFNGKIFATSRVYSVGSNDSQIHVDPAETGVPVTTWAWCTQNIPMEPTYPGSTCIGAPQAWYDPTATNWGYLAGIEGETGGNEPIFNAQVGAGLHGGVQDYFAIGSFGGSTTTFACYNELPHL